jgi:hypothetical protein
MNVPTSKSPEALNEIRRQFADALAASEQARQLAGDTVWTRDQSPIIIESNLTIPHESTLTIEPGVVVLFNQANMNITGKMFALGTAGERILFTSIDDYKGSASRQTHWPGIWVIWGGSAKLSYVDFRYAGWDRWGGSDAIAIGTTGRFEMDHSTIKYSLGNGLKIGGGAVEAEAITVSSSVISDNRFQGIITYASYVEVMDGTQIRDNGGDGIYWHMRAPTRQTSVMNSDIIGNAGAGIALAHFYQDVSVEQESYGHGNNIYKNGADAQLFVWYPNVHLRHGIIRRPPPLPPLLVDWSDNYWGAPLLVNGCLWSQAPAFSNHTHLSYEPGNPCEQPPKGPISYSTYEKQVPREVCSDGYMYCAVDQANAVPAASTPFDHSVPEPHAKG